MVLIVSFHRFVDCWHLYLFSDWNNCFLLKTFSIPKLKYWITIHDDSLEISSRNAHFSSIFFLTFKTNEFKHAGVYISAKPSRLCNCTLLILSFKNKCPLRKSGQALLSPPNYFFPRALFPNYPFLPSSPLLSGLINISAKFLCCKVTGKIRTPHQDDHLPNTQNDNGATEIKYFG